MFAATVAGIYPSVGDAMKAMGSGTEREYQPDPERAAQYEEFYVRYSRLAEFVEHETMAQRRTA
jgi:L-ribulokinase